MTLENLMNQIDESDCVLIGIGEEYRVQERSKQEVLSALDGLFEIVKNKNYYVLDICDDRTIFESKFGDKKIAAPFCDYMERDEDESRANPFDRENNPTWDKYMKWLSFTLNNKLLVLELGCLMGAMELIRWPFEKTVSLNNKSKLVRINESFPFVPAEISEKSISVKCNSVDFFLK